MYSGGLQVWDTRKRSCRQSDLKWGLTGAPQDIGKVGSLGDSPCVQSHVTLQHLCSCCLPACLLHAICIQLKGCRHPTPACKPVPVALEVACVACAHNIADTCTHARARVRAITAGSDCTQCNGRSKCNASRKSMCFAAYQAAGIHRNLFAKSVSEWASPE